MRDLRKLLTELLEPGTDLKLDDADVERIKECLPTDAPPSADDIDALVELRTKARSVAPAFDDLFLPLFSKFLLADGEISLAEHYHLLKVLFGDGVVSQREKAFLLDLRRKVASPSPEFDDLCRQALRQ
jgi:hypothetical protein